MRGRMPTHAHVPGAQVQKVQRTKDFSKLASTTDPLTRATVAMVFNEGPSVQRQGVGNGGVSANPLVNFPLPHCPTSASGEMTAILT